MSETKKYLVHSTYRVTGSAVIEAKSRAEAARIGRDGYEDGTRPLFDFSDPHSETKMQAVWVPDDWALSEVERDPWVAAEVRSTDTTNEGKETK
jgi:hypothetical protein